MKKRFLMVVLALVVLIGALTLTASAATTVDSGSCGENVTWVLDSDGVLTISGTGKMKDLNDYKDVPWYSYRKEITTVIIEHGVTSIGDYAFYACSSLTGIVIPGSVTSIGENTFGYCSDLTDIVIPNSVTSIGSYAFYDCDGLTEITIPNSVTTIGDNAFRSCSSLTGIVIPDSVTSIGGYAFDSCSSLTDVYITDLAAWCGISFSSGYSNPLSRSANLWLNNELVTGVVIPNSVTRIGAYAFYGCTSLTEIIIPDSVTSIGSYAFYDCDGLTEIVIPDSVTGIGSGAFSNCSSLTEIIIPDSVTTIGLDAFNGCSSLTDIVIPNSVTSIGYRAFNACSSLTEIVIPDSVTSIGYRAFSDCSSLTEIVIPDSVSSIDICAFWGCSSLTSVTIGNRVTSIGDEAFGDCDGLTSVTVKGGGIFINGTVFTNCAKLTEFRFMSNPPKSNFKILLNNKNKDYTVYYPAGDSSWDAIMAADYDAKSVTWIPVTSWNMMNFKTVNSYTAGMFGDVVRNSWYEPNTARAYELGLMKGTGDAAFSPTKNITIAEVVTMAARIHSIYQTGTADFTQGSPWYQVYVDYVIENGIIRANSYSNYNALATRADCAAILGASVPESELQAINNITAIPDVTQDSDWGKAVYRLYNAGVLTGTDEYGTFAPANKITRAEVATIATRIVDASLRKSYSIP